MRCNWIVKCNWLRSCILYKKNTVPEVLNWVNEKLHQRKIFRTTKKTDFPDYTILTYQDSIFKLSEVICLLCLSKILRLKASSKPFIDSKTITAISNRKKLFKITKNVVWRQTKTIFDWLKWLFRKLVQRKRNLIFTKKLKRMPIILKNYGKLLSP